MYPDVFTESVCVVVKAMHLPLICPTVRYHQVPLYKRKEFSQECPLTLTQRTSVTRASQVDSFSDPCHSVSFSDRNIM
jgi:hypothetical protein